MHLLKFNVDHCEDSVRCIRLLYNVHSLIQNNSLYSISLIDCCRFDWRCADLAMVFTTCRMNCFCSSTLVKELLNAELERHCALQNHLQLLLNGRYLDSVCTVPGCPTLSGHAPVLMHIQL